MEIYRTILLRRIEPPFVHISFKTYFKKMQFEALFPHFGPTKKKLV